MAPFSPLQPCKPSNLGTKGARDLSGAGSVSSQLPHSPPLDSHLDHSSPPTPLPDNSSGATVYGRLQLFATQWLITSTDAWIHQIVSFGYSLDLCFIPRNHLIFLQGLAPQGKRPWLSKLFNHLANIGASKRFLPLKNSLASTAHLHHPQEEWGMTKQPIY